MLVAAWYSTRATGCTQALVELAAGTAFGTGDAKATRGVTCAQWEKLPTLNNYAGQLLTATLPDVEIVAPAPAPPLPSTNEPVPSSVTSPAATPAASAPANGAAIRLFMPRIVAPDGLPDAPAMPQDASRTAAQLYLPAITRDQTQAPVANNTGEIPATLIVLATSTSGPGGDYSATPLSVVSDYQTDLFTGAFATGYPLAVPPAAAGAAPAVSLGLQQRHRRRPARCNRNNQPGFAGIGWELNTGAVTRLFKACEPQTPGSSTSGLSTAGEAYVLTLNGVSSRLVKQSSNLFRLQDDPAWQVQQLTTTVAAHPDQFKVYWSVTTPDGTRYRFGGEIEPETGADQNSVFFAGIGGAPFTYVWRWNLDHVENTNGNVASYFYAVELNSYKSNSYVHARRTQPYRVHQAQWPNRTAACPRALQSRTALSSIPPAPPAETRTPTSTMRRRISPALAPADTQPLLSGQNIGLTACSPRCTTPAAGAGAPARITI